MNSQNKNPDLHPPTGEGPNVGRPVRRLEDERLLRGGSRYVSDLIAKSDALRVKVLRSPHAHARILAVDTTAARAMPGVVAVLTADDLAGVGDLPCDWQPPGMIAVPLHPVLARDRARYAGEPIAAVAAETAPAAEDALAAIAVSYEVLPAVADQEAAIEPGAAQLHDALPNNGRAHAAREPGGGPVRRRGLSGTTGGGARPPGGGPRQRCRARRRGVLARITPAEWLGSHEPDPVFDNDSYRR
jgi:aerobic carbon-monoxide dehydrogenase large subunit